MGAKSFCAGMIHEISQCYASRISKMVRKAIIYSKLLEDDLVIPLQLNCLISLTR